MLNIMVKNLANAVQFLFSCQKLVETLQSTLPLTISCSKLFHRTKQFTDILQKLDFHSNTWTIQGCKSSVEGMCKSEKLAYKILGTFMLL